MVHMDSCTIAVLRLSIFLQVLFAKNPDKAKELLGPGMLPAKINIRIVNFPESALQIRELKASCIGATLP